MSQVSVAQEALQHNAKVEELVKTGAITPTGELVETPPAAEPAKTETPAATPTPPVAATPSAPTEIPAEYASLVDNLVQEKIKGVNPFSSETVKFLNELERSGVALTPEVIQESITDYDKFDTSSIVQAKELVVKKMKIENPAMSEVKIRQYIDLQTKGLKEAEDTEEYQEAMLNLTVEAEKSRNALKERQKTFKLPTRESQEIINQRNAEKAQAQKREIEGQFSELAKNFKGVQYNIEKDEHLVGFTPEQLNAVRELYVNPSKIIQSFQSAKGFDGEGFFKFLVNGLYAKDQVSAAVAQAMQKGVKAAIIEADNAAPAATPAAPAPAQVKSIAEQQREQWGGGQSGYKIPVV